MRKATTETRIAEGYNYYHKVFYKNEFVALAIESIEGIAVLLCCNEEDCDYRIAVFSETPFYLAAEDEHQKEALYKFTYKWLEKQPRKVQEDWTKEEDQLLIQHFKKASKFELCLLLKRSYRQISSRHYDINGRKNITKTV